MRFSESDFLHVFGALFVLMLGLVCGNCWSSMARATHDDDVVHELALAVAATAANEAGFDSPRDVAVVYEAASYHGRGDNARALRWLRRHSARVNGERTCAAGRNCRWSRGLRWSDAKPDEWPDSVRWIPRNWERQRGLALRLVTGEETRRVCDVPIVSWGSPQDFEANRFGYVPVDCGARNLGASTVELVARARRARLALGRQPM